MRAHAHARTRTHTHTHTIDDVQRHTGLLFSQKYFKVSAAYGIDWVPGFTRTQHLLGHFDWPNDFELAKTPQLY